MQSADLHIANFAKLVEKGLRSGETLRKWHGTRKKIEDFLITQFQIRDISLSGIDYSFAVKYYNYLTLDRDTLLGETAAKKEIKNTK